MQEGFLYIDASKKFRIDLKTQPLTIPVNSQIKLESYLYIYLLSYSIDKGHEQSIYSKAPLSCYLGKPESSSTQDQCRVHPKGTTSDRIQLRHIHIRNSQSPEFRWKHWSPRMVVSHSLCGRTAQRKRWGNHRWLWLLLVGQQTSGQALYMYWVIQEIARQTER